MFSPNTSVSPVSNIPPLLHTHPSIYHPRCIIFFSQHFSFTCQYHSTIAPYSSIHLPPILHNVFLPVLEFSPVSIIPPLLHTHPFIYHQRCIMFFSQHFSFPLSVPFHHCSITIFNYMLSLEERQAANPGKFSKRNASNFKDTIIYCRKSKIVAC